MAAKSPSRPTPPAKDTAATPSTSPTTAPLPQSGRTAAEWQELLARLAPEGYEAKHPGRIAKLADLLVLHAGDPGWEAGTLSYLLSDAPTEARLDLWIRCAEALPANPAISEALVRAILNRTEGRSDLDALLLAQTARMPEDPFLLWVRSAVGFRKSRPEEALALLAAAADLPAWKDWSLEAALRADEVKEAIEGPLGPVQRYLSASQAASSSTRLFFLLRGAPRFALAQAEAIGAGDPARVRGILQSAAHMGRALSQGARGSREAEIGLKAEYEVLSTLKRLARDSGETAVAEEASLRLAHIEAERAALHVWTRKRFHEFERRLRSFQGLRQLERGLDTPGIPMEDQIRALENLLTAEDAAYLRALSAETGREMTVYRSTQPPPAAPSSP